MVLLALYNFSISLDLKYFLKKERMARRESNLGEVAEVSRQGEIELL